MSGYPSEKPYRSVHGVDHPAAPHARRRSSTSTALQTTLLLQPDRTSVREPSPVRRVARLARWRTGRGVVVGTIALLLLSALLVLPGRKTVRYSHADWDASHRVEGSLALSDGLTSNHDAVDNLRLSVSPDTLVADTDFTARENGKTTGQDSMKLPLCEKTVLFRFAGLHGFGSEVTLLYRVAAIAAHFGYQVFLDDEKWNYGAWSDYFLDLDLGTKRAKLVLTADEVRALTAPTASSTTISPAEFVPRWATRPHVVWFSRDMDALDLTYLRLFSNATELEHLHAADLAHREPARNHDEGSPSPLFLTPEETLPPAFEEAFEVMSRVASRAWRVNDEIEREVATLAKRVGLDAREDTRTGISDAGELLIAVHVRLGDKFLELSLNDELVSAYLAAAVDSVHSLLGLPPSGDPQWVTRELASAARRSVPTLVLMSDDDEGAVQAFRRHPHAGSFRIVGTSEEVSHDATDGGSAEEKTAVDRRRAHAPVPAGFNETAFNRLPLPSRVAATRQFVRDLTFLSRRADALVVTGSSNVGRLLMMLFDAENTNRSKAEGELQSRRREMRSLDTRWFPTARYV
ncbi:hypothetical protein B0A53_03477 [Rhodotorula sp. CCFEE 5036]|nr:hypothetical protein B0A53_03477 [Rhodotorula sp. CCFEE 5036]